MTTTTAVAHRRQCVYCTQPHDLGAVHSCGSAETEHIDNLLWYCLGCRSLFTLRADAPISHGMCEDASRRWRLEYGLAEPLSCGGAVDREFEQATTPLPVERDGNAFHGLAVAILIMAGVIGLALGVWGLLHAISLWTAVR